jgi:hypothetical protein
LSLRIIARAAASVAFGVNMPRFNGLTALGKSWHGPC